MAVNRKPGTDWDELVKRAAAEIKAINPHIGAPTAPLSDEDSKYIVSFPEWGPATHTHEATYEEAVKNGSEVLDDLT